MEQTAPFLSFYLSEISVKLVPHRSILVGCSQLGPPQNCCFQNSTFRLILKFIPAVPSLCSLAARLRRALVQVSGRLSHKHAAQIAQSVCITQKNLNYGGLYGTLTEFFMENLVYIRLCSSTYYPLNILETNPTFFNVSPN